MISEFSEDHANSFGEGASSVSTSFATLSARLPLKVASRSIAGNRPDLRKRKLQILSRIFSLAIKYKVTDTNPCREVPLFPENNRRVRYLLDEEEVRLFSVLVDQRAHLRALVMVSIGTGMRKGDLLNLRWERVDFQRGVIHVPNSKTGKNYSVPMNEDVRAALLERRSEANNSDYVFVNPETKKPSVELKRSFSSFAAGRNSRSALARFAAYAWDQVGGGWF